MFYCCHFPSNILILTRFQHLHMQHNNDTSCITTTILSIDELGQSDNIKHLLKITDLLGRETKGTKNEPLFYIYENGTVEKRIIIE